jgi:hypothetical protein
MAKIFLEVSMDEGCTWKDARGRDVSVAGKEQHRLIWRRNGRFDTTAVFRFSLFEAAEVSIGQLTADILGEQK